MLLLVLICELAGFAQASPNAKELQPQTTIQGKLRAGATEIYSIRLEAGSVAEVTLEQGGADLMATVVPPPPGNR